MSSTIEAPAEVPQSEEVWLEELRDLARHADRSQWAIGDHLNLGAAAFGEKYTEAEEATGLAKQTLKNLASVAGKFDSSRRRYESHLTFGHFESVASLKDEAEQDRLLKKAERNRWSVKLLRNEVRLVRDQASSAKPDPDAKDRVVVMVPRHHYSDFARAASVHGKAETEIREGIASWFLGLAIEAIGKEVSA